MPKKNLPTIIPSPAIWITGLAVCILVLVWWLSPLTSGVIPSKQLNNTVPKNENVQAIITSLREELAINNEQITLLQRWLEPGIAIEPSVQARQLATQIPDEADSYALALKAIAQKRFADARRLLHEAQNLDKFQRYESIGLMEQYDGRYAEAAQWLMEMLTLRPDDPRLLSKTASALQLAGKYTEADSLYQRALVIRKKTLGPNHPEVAVALTHLAVLNYAQGKCPQSELYLKRALAIREKALGPNHPAVAKSLDNLAGLYYAQGQYAKTETLLQRALLIREKIWGPDHPHVVNSLNNMAALYDTQGKCNKAELYLQRALTIRERTLGANHPEVAVSLNNLAELYHSQGKYSQAESLLQRSLSIREKTLGTTSLEVFTVLEGYAQLLRKMGRAAEAAPLEARAKTILDQQAALHPVNPSR